MAGTLPLAATASGLAAAAATAQGKALPQARVAGTLPLTAEVAVAGLGVAMQQARPQAQVSCRPKELKMSREGVGSQALWMGQLMVQARWAQGAGETLLVREGRSLGVKVEVCLVVKAG